jgi:hypothetical protein
MGKEGLFAGGELPSRGLVKDILDLKGTGYYCGETAGKTSTSG